MKKVIVYPVVFLIFFILTGCTENKNKEEKKINAKEQSKLEESLVIWNKEKQRYNNSYQYTTEFSSWTGFRGKTTLIIKNNEITERHYLEFEQEVISSSWSEVNKEKLGTHQWEGAALEFIEDLYRKCEKDVLTKNPSENYIDLLFHKNGILKTCTYFHKNCVDDCTFGVSIDTITFLEEES